MNPFLVSTRKRTCQSKEQIPYRCDGSGTCPSCLGKGSRLVREVSVSGTALFESRSVQECGYCAGWGICPDCGDERE